MADLNVGALKGSITIDFGSVREAEKAIRSLQGTFSTQVKAAKQVEQAQRSSSKAASDSAKATRQAEAAEKARINALSQADAQMRNINQASKEYLIQTDQQKASVNAARAAINNYKSVVEQSGARSVQAAQAKAEMRKKVDEARTSVTRHGKEVKNLQGATQDLTKAVQLALGPLSGVASRITALTALFNRNTLAVAGVVGAFTGLSVAMFQSIRAGAQFEQEMFKIETVLQATGNSVRFTSEEINDLAVNLGEATLTSANQARRAASILMTFGITSKQAFEEALFAAQGLSAVMGGGLESNTRRIGRLLEDPADNLSSLTRAGVQFTKQQEEMIERMQRTGDLAGAQAVVMERLGVFTKAATGEAQGLAGALDTTLERMNRLFENASLSAGAVDSLTEVVNAFSGELEALAENERIINSLGTLFSTLGKIFAGTALVVIENVDKIAAALAGGGIIVAIRGLNALFIRLTGTSVAAASSMGLFTKATTGASAAMARLNAVIRANPIGALLSVAGAVATWVYFSSEVDNANSKLEDTRAKVAGITEAFAQLDRGDVVARIEERAAAQERLTEKLVEQQSALQALRFERLKEARAGGTTSESTREQIDAQEKLVESTKEALQSIRDLNEEDKELADRLQTLTKNFSSAGSEFASLNEKYVNGGDKVKKWREELDTAVGILKNFESQVGNDIEGQKQLEKQYGITRAGLTRLIGEMRDADPRLDVWRDFKEELGEIDAEIRALSSGLNIDADITKALLGPNADPRVISRLAKDLNMVGASAERVGIAIQGRRDKQEALEEFLGFTTEDLRGEMREIQREFAEISQGARVRFGGDVPSEIQAQIDAQEQMQKQLLRFEGREVATTPFTDLEKLEQELLQRQQMLQQYFGTESEDYKKHLSDLKAESDRSRVFLEFAQGAEQASDIVTSAMDVMQTANRENSSSYKAMAMMQATIAGALAISKIWAENPNPAFAIPMTALVSANIGAQIAAIQGANFATGGMVRGPGTGTSDSIPANLSNGEFVMRAEAVRRIGAAQLNAMNQGRMMGMASGGMVGGGSSVGGNTTVNVIDQRSGGAPVETRERTDSEGNRSIEVLVKDLVNRGISSGDFDRTMGRSYGVRRNGRRV